MYNFETFQDRDALYSRKYQVMHELKKDVSKGIVPLSVADMEFNLAPEIERGLKEALNDCILGYPGDSHYYRESVKNWMKRRNAWDIEEDWIVETAGVVTGLYTGVSIASQKGDGIIVFPPVYGPFFSAIEDQERRVVKVDLIERDKDYFIDFDNFEREAKKADNKALIFCNPHNPLGRVWTLEEIDRIAKIALENDLYIISDEIHADLIMKGISFTCFANTSVKEINERLIVLTAASKTFNIAGLKTSNAIISDGKLRASFVDWLNKQHLLGANIMGLWATALAYNEAEPWLIELLDVLEDNRNFVEEFLEEKLPEIKTTKIKATYLMYLDFRALGLSTEALDDLIINKAELFLVDGSFFHDKRQGFKRLNIGCPKWVLKNALERLEKAIRG